MESQFMYTFFVRLSPTSYQIFTPILHWIDGLDGPRPHPVPYPYGSRGPKEMDAFTAKYGYKRDTEA